MAKLTMMRSVNGLTKVGLVVRGECQQIRLRRAYGYIYSLPRRAKDLELNVELCIAGRSDIISPACCQMSESHRRGSLAGGASTRRIRTASRMFQHPHRSHCQFHLVPGSAMRSLPFLPGEAGGGTWARGGRRAGERQKKHCTGCGRADGRRKGMCKEERIMGGVER